MTDNEAVMTGDNVDRPFPAKPSSNNVPPQSLSPFFPAVMPSLFISQPTSLMEKITSNGLNLSKLSCGRNKLGYITDDSLCPECSIKQRRKLNDERVYDFLVSLNWNLDEVRGRIVARALFPSPEEAFSEVRREESHRKVMLNDDLALSSTLEGSALVSRNFPSHRRPVHDSRSNK
ncbi:hypothetical protein JRO89_XS10G0169100 [Xanthoceras sorbifolium]|uniref:Uncharacterized protein n=1 Tax=Xanthoceras sorbifolium TaxID=99658 RepID=A0ABQ8HJ22_9ROSI|nr:hypothetical protein JRO89_XS10G0169100 [Xanthoceras sorbifolium]